MSKIPLVLCHDGAVDEFASVALLCAPDFVQQYDLKGVIVINGDTLGVAAYWCTKRILNMCGQGHIPVGLSQTRAYNGFPWAYRQFPLILNTLPALPELPDQDHGPIANGDQLLADIFSNADADTLTLLSLGGMTPVADVLNVAGNPAKLRNIFWMGGVFDTKEPNGQYKPCPGNIDGGIVPGAPMYSEWNVFYDPFAAQSVYDNSNNVKFYQFPLNVTNDYPNCAQWIRHEMNPLARSHQVVDFLANAYSAVVPQGGASLWDVVTTIGLMNNVKNFFSYESRDIRVETSFGANEGRLMNATKGGGRSVQVAQPAYKTSDDNTKVDEEVRNYALEQWAAIPNYSH